MLDVTLATLVDIIIGITTVVVLWPVMAVLFMLLQSLSAWTFRTATAMMRRGCLSQ